MNEFNPDNFPNRTCCGVMEYFVSDGWAIPFERPIAVNRDTLNMEVVGWSIRLYKKTSAGHPSKQKGPFILMSFCPFCGKNIESSASDDRPQPFAEMP